MKMNVQSHLILYLFLVFPCIWANHNSHKYNETHNHHRHHHLHRDHHIVHSHSMINTNKVYNKTTKLIRLESINNDKIYNKSGIKEVHSIGVELAPMKQSLQTLAVNAHTRKNHKIHPGRHICPKHKLIRTPDRSYEMKQNNENNGLTGSSTSYDVFKQTTYDCCPGWERTSTLSNGCYKAICRVLCQNGGKCIKPDLCKCQNGFKGTYCEQDINECETEKPCDHLCFNTNGSYYCRCKNGFILLNDKQSCRKLDQRQIAFEASELEDVDFDELSARVDQLNLELTRAKETDADLLNRILRIGQTIDILQNNISNLEKKQTEFNRLRELLNYFEVRTKKLEDTLNNLYINQNVRTYTPERNQETIPWNWNDGRYINNYNTNYHSHKFGIQDVWNQGYRQNVQP